MKINQRDAIIKALEARGERRVEDRSLSKYTKYTRRFLGQRGTLGELLISPSPDRYWYVGHFNGTLRVGSSSTTSRRVKAETRTALVAEGRAVK